MRNYDKASVHDSQKDGYHAPYDAFSRLARPQATILVSSHTLLTVEPPQNMDADIPFSEDTPR
jgi:hypothetical protein